MLFKDDLSKDNSPIDNTRITQVLLYYSEEEAKEFKALCKKGMKNLYEDYTSANVCDFLLKLLRKYYGKGVQVEGSVEAEPSGSSEGNLPFGQLF